MRRLSEAKSMHRCKELGGSSDQIHAKVEQTLGRQNNWNSRDFACNMCHLITVTPEVAVKMHHNNCFLEHIVEH